MTAVFVSWNKFDIADATRKTLRVVLVAAVLTVGSLQVTKCSNDYNDYDDHAAIADKAENKFR